MRPGRIAAIAAVGAGVIALWLVPGLDPVLGVMATFLGAAALGAYWTGYGGPFLALALAEAFAVGLGAAEPVLAVLAQAPIAALVVGPGDRTALLLGAGAAVLAAAPVLLFRHTLVPLLGLVAAAAVAVAALLALEAWLRRRVSGDRE